jgi:cation diffusion facilitator family transporter
MRESKPNAAFHSHDHVFLAADHERSERKTWAVIVLCGAMMAAEIVGGILFGSIALVADGLHMSTHAGALLLAALAYSYARKHVSDGRFTFGTGKFGDLAGFSSAIVLAMIAILIGYESVSRLFQPVPIHFAEAIPIACLGLAVNIISAWLLSSGGHHHHDHSGHGRVGHGHAGHTEADHGHAGDQEAEHRVATAGGALTLEIHEDGVPPRFRLRTEGTTPLSADSTIETLRPDGSRQVFGMTDRGEYLESAEEIPEPHAFVARILTGAGAEHPVVFEEHHHGHAGAHRDNNMRAAVIHVMADAAVSILVILGLILAKVFGWLWMDPLAGIVGACVIASWSYGLIRDTGAILLDMNPDRELADKLRKAVEAEGDRLDDLHLWRVGPGHLAAILSVATNEPRDPIYYRNRLACFKILSHVTVEVVPRNAA